MSDILQPLTLSLFILMLFILMSHPLLLVIAVIGQTFVIIVHFLSISFTSWNNYILFLIFLGGLLIIFIYLSAMSPNEIMQNSKPTYLFLMLSSLALPLIAPSLNTKTVKLADLNGFNNNFISNMVPWIIAYLLMTMAVTMYMISYIKTPLKQQML